MKHYESAFIKPIYDYFNISKNTVIKTQVRIRSSIIDVIIFVKNEKQKINEIYSFSNKLTPFNYILRTEYGICINEKNRNHIDDIYRSKFNYVKINPISINFEEHTKEENNIIQSAFNTYFNLPESKLICSTDKTKSRHSKNLTKNRNKNRDQKNLFLM